MKDQRYSEEDGDADAAYFRSLSDGQRRAETRRASAYEIRTSPADDVHAAPAPVEPTPIEKAVAGRTVPESTRPAEAPSRPWAQPTDATISAPTEADAVAADAHRPDRAAEPGTVAEQPAPGAAADRPAVSPRPWATAAPAATVAAGGRDRPSVGGRVGLSEAVGADVPPPGGATRRPIPVPTPVQEYRPPVNTGVPAPRTPDLTKSPAPVSTGTAPTAAGSGEPADVPTPGLALDPLPPLPPALNPTLPPVTGPAAEDRTELIPVYVDPPPLAHIAPEQPGQVETVTCPECGQATSIDLAKRRSDDFCPACDFPLFWAKTLVIAPSGADTGASLRRLPGTVGRAATAGVPCPHCSEPNSLSALICVRCGGDMHPVAPPAPVMVPPPEPLPEPEPEPPDRTWLWVLLLCLSVLAITVIVAWTILY